MPPRPAAKPDDPDHHLHQRGGVWYVRYMLGGKPAKQSLGTTDVKKARRERDRILKEAAARREGRVIDHEKTWQDAVDAYLVHQDAHVRAGELSGGAAKRYSCSIVQITAALGWEPGDGADGTPTRTIDLGRAAAMLADMPRKGRLFSGLPADSAVVSTRYGQWCRQRQAREEKAAKAEHREAVKLDRYRLHDLRHAFACASLVDDDTCIYRLSGHLGHTMVQTTEIYTAHLKRDGAMWKYGRRPGLFGSLPPAEGKAARAA